jgi:enoyl-CoA hydratase/carnithine racemase
MTQVSRSEPRASPRPATPIVSLGTAIERLQTPDAFEAYSVLTGEPLFAVDLAQDAGWPAEIALAVAREALSELPCPSVALAQGLLAPAAEAVISEFDAVVATREELELVADGVFAQPLAAQALAQLLRLSAGRSVHEGLIAESLVYSTLQSGPEFGAWLAAQPEPKVRPPPEGPAVRAERVEGRLELWLNRPEKRNAFSAEMRDALCEALALAVMDHTIDRVVLLGEGPVFCSGGDLDEFGTLPDPATAHAIRSTRHPARLLHALEPRVECVVHGTCVGAGIELPAFTTRVVARPDASFRLPELSMGLVPGAGGTVSLPRRIGRQRTAWLALTGVAIDVETAHDWRLIDAIEA